MRLDQVASADFRRVHVQVLGDHVHYPFNNEYALDSAHASVSPAGALVGEHPIRLAVVVVDVVRPNDGLPGGHGLQTRSHRPQAMCALVHEYLGTDTQDRSVVSRGDRHLNPLLMGMGAGQNVFHPVFHPLDRPANLLGEEGQSNGLRVAGALDPEIASKVGGYHSHGMLG